MLIYTNYLIEALLVGTFGALLSYLLNTLLSYGHILGKIRYKAALRAANKTKDKELIKLIKDLPGLRYIEGYDIDALDQESDRRYWEVVKERPSFMPWVCLVCLSLRLTLVIVFIFISIDMFYTSSFTEFIGGSFLFMLGSLSITHLIISKL